MRRSKGLPVLAYRRHRTVQLLIDYKDVDTLKKYADRKR